jgi:ribonuclease HI
VIEAKTLPQTSSQQAELIALTCALQLAKDKIINIYTDSKYTYNIIHSNVLIWREDS